MKRPKVDAVPQDGVYQVKGEKFVESMPDSPLDSRWKYDSANGLYFLDGVGVGRSWSELEEIYPL